ncbi:MAG: carboxymuconolactone decarboxylase family protein [Acidimicrobiia bacterium]
MPQEMEHAAEVRSLAPDAFDAVARVVATAGNADAMLVDAARAGVSSALDTGHNRSGVPADSALRTFATQFVIDVGSVTNAQRSAAMSVLGSNAFEFVQLLYVFDFLTRLRAAFDQLFDVDPIAPRADASPSLWDSLEAMFASVARLAVLDPVTTEIVRLRGARAHNCRLCKSIRNVRAARNGADEALYDGIDRFETSTLPERHKVALRLTDAYLWRPMQYPPGLDTQVHATFSPAEIVEILLDVARNAANKIAVAFGADDAHVSEGVEYFDTDADGQLVYGLDPS